MRTLRKMCRIKFMTLEQQIVSSTELRLRLESHFKLDTDKRRMLISDG